MIKERFAIVTRDVAKRREATSSFLDTHGIWKNEVVDERGGLTRLSELLTDGNGAVVFFTHPRKSDPFRVVKVLVDRIAAIANRQIIIPVAQHQHVAALNLVGRIEGVDTSHTVVTPHTEERGKNKLHPTQKIPLYKDVFSSGVRAGVTFLSGKNKKRFGLEEKDKSKIRFERAKNNFRKRNKPLPVSWGVPSYLRSVAEDVGEHKQVMVISAQGGRSGELGSPSERDAITPVFKLLDKPGLENTAVAFIGVNPKGARPKKDHTFNKGESSLEVNETLTIGEVRLRAAAENVSIPQFVFKKLAEVSSPEYVTGYPAAA